MIKVSYSKKIDNLNPAKFKHLKMFLKFCRDELGVADADLERGDLEEKRKWVSEAVQKFACSAGFLEQTLPMRERHA